MNIAPCKQQLFDRARPAWHALPKHAVAVRWNPLILIDSARHPLYLGGGGTQLVERMSASKVNTIKVNPMHTHTHK